MSSFESMPFTRVERGFESDAVEGARGGRSFESVRELADRLAQERESEAMAALSEALERAREEGRAQAMAEHAGAMADSLTRLAELHRSYLERSREGVIELAIAIAEKLVRTKLAESSEALHSFYEHAVATAADVDDELVVQVSPGDLERLAQCEPSRGAGDARSSLRLEADPQLSAGDVVVRGATTEVDARVTRLLELFRSALLPVVHSTGETAGADSEEGTS